MWVYITSLAATSVALLELAKDWREHKTTARRVAVFGLIVLTGIGGALGTYFADKAADKQHSEDQAQIAKLQTAVDAGNANLSARLDAGNANLNARIDELKLLLQAKLEQATPSSPYTVRLSWQPSEPAPVARQAAVGYYLYRSRGRQGSHSVRLNHVPITTTFYEDETVEPGNTYYYVVRAVSAIGVESRPSNTIKKEVPARPH
jgi:hypothetical protein